MPEPKMITNLARLLQQFFCLRLIQQYHCSPQTVASYRDTFRLLLQFAETKLSKQIVNLDITDIDASLVLSFLDHLEADRHNSIRSRNTRLAAIRSFLHYAALQEPSTISTIQQVLAIPMKRFEQPVVTFLNREEIEMILAAPNLQTWSGRRDRTLLITMYNTGARVSEIVTIRCIDIEKGKCKAVHLHGKGRKERVLPLWKRTSTLIQQWLPQIDPNPYKPLFPNRFGQAMTRSGIEKRLRTAVITVSKQCPSLKGKKVSPHTIRHTTAIHLLQSGVDLAVIALWLGHESVATTHAYMQANIEMKENALKKIKEPHTQSVRFRPSSDVLTFLDSL